MMKTHRSSLLLLLLVLGLISISGSASSSSAVSKESLGIPPQDASYFKSEIIKCKDGSKKFTKSQLNDDFCDCPDGTDEPGTSACPNGKFYCKNIGDAPLSLFSSRVNDGICDCCDGSDEYDGKVKCANTCWEAGKVARDKLNKKITTYQKGVIIRKQEVEQAKQAISKEEAELSKLKNEEKILKGLVQQLKEQKEQIEKAEEKERLEKEKEEKSKNESNEKDNEHEKDSTEPEHGENHELIGISDEPASEQGFKSIFDSDDVIDFTYRNDEDSYHRLHKHLGNLDKLDQNYAHLLSKDAAVVNDEVVEAENDYDDDDVGKDAPHSHAVEQHAADDKNTIDTENGHDAESSATSDQVEKQEKDEFASTEGLSKEELGRLVASRWTGENSGQQTEKDNEAKEEHKGDTETQDSAHDADYEGYSSEEDKYKYDEDATEADVDEDFEEDDNNDADNSYKPDSEDEIDFSDISTSSSPSWLEKIQLTVRNILQAVNLFQTPVDKSDAARIRKEYDDASSKLSKIQSRISNLDEKLKHDFGPEKEFYSSYDRCFENKQNKYVYKVCPFKKASQVEGHSTTQLGHWEKFEDSYRTMLFSSGDKCWNGPDRSLKVKLRCGLDNEITDVDEPSRCEYVAVLSTPALCLEEKLKELQHKLELMNKEQPQSHDEL